MGSGNGGPGVGLSIYTSAAFDDDVTSLSFICLSLMPPGLAVGSTLSLGAWSAKVTKMWFTGDTYTWGPGSLYPVIQLNFDTPTATVLAERTGIAVS